MAPNDQGAPDIDLAEEVLLPRRQDGGTLRKSSSQRTFSARKNPKLLIDNKNLRKKTLTRKKKYFGIRKALWENWPKKKDDKERRRRENCITFSLLTFSLADEN